MSASASLESASENRACPRGPVPDALPAEPRRRAALGSRHSAGVRRRFWRRKEAGAGRRQARAHASGGDRHKRRRRSPQAYRDDPRNARKRTQESRRRTQSCNFYRILRVFGRPVRPHEAAREEKAQVEFSPFAQAPRISGKNCIGAFDTETSTRNWPERLDGKTRALESLRAETKRRGLDWGAGRQGECKGHPERGFCQSLFLKRE